MKPTDGFQRADRPAADTRFFTEPPIPPALRPDLHRGRRLPSLSEFGIPLVTDFIVLSPEQAAGFGGFQPGILDANGNPLGVRRQRQPRPIDFGEATGNLLNFNWRQRLYPAGNWFPGAAPGRHRPRRISCRRQYRLFGEAWYANSKGSTIGPSPNTTRSCSRRRASLRGQLILSADNPFLSPQARTIILQNLAANPFTDDPDIFYLTRANTDLISASRRARSRSTASSAASTARSMRSARAELRAGRQLRPLRDQGDGRAIVQQNLENALIAVRDAGGNIVCAPAP
jgi:hypothetical protein